MSSRTPLLAATAGVVVLVALILLLRHNASTNTPTVNAGSALSAGCASSDAAFSGHRSGVWLTLSGSVSRLLPDAHGRYLHQRFVLRCADNHTVLIVNDVDIGRRVPVQQGDTVAVRGQYIWNDQGGLVHFTHHDPEGGQGGWILDRGKVYALEQPRPWDKDLATIA